MRSFFQKNCSAKLKRVVDHVIGKLEKKGFSVTSVSPNSSNPDSFVKVEISMFDCGAPFKYCFFIPQANDGNTRRVVKRELPEKQTVDLPSFVDGIADEVLNN